MVEKLASAIYNNVVAGLVGVTSNPTISMEQLKDSVIEEYLLVVKEYSMKNIIPRKDLLMAINCIETDCEALDQCPSCSTSNPAEIPETHFEIPQIINDLAETSIEFIGSTDKSTQYKVYTDTSFQYHKYLRRGAEKPFVYIQTTPNSNNMYDG